MLGLSDQNTWFVGKNLCISVIIGLICEKRFYISFLYSVNDISIFAI